MQIVTNPPLDFDFILFPTFLENIMIIRDQ